jgi:cysteine sulfinate desulfinase/cysteine desulfurase-like protein
MGGPDADGPLRFTLGHDTTEAEVDELLQLLPGIVARATH